MVAVMYYEQDGDSIINVPPWTWMRVDYEADEVGGDYPAGVTFDISVEDSGGSVKATAQVVSAAGLGWQGDGFFTQPGDWVPLVPDILPGDVVEFSGGDGYLGHVRVGIIEGTINPAMDLGRVSFPCPGCRGTPCSTWNVIRGERGRSVSTHPSSRARPISDTDPGYICDWSTDPWNMVEHQPVAVVYYEPDGDGVIREFGEPTSGFIFADGFESGDTIPWSPAVF